MRHRSPVLLVCVLLVCVLLTAAARPTRRSHERAPRPDPVPALVPPPPAVQQAREEERRVAEQRVAAAGRLRETEEAAMAAAQQVSVLGARREEAERRLAERAAALGPLLPLAERLALYPAETLLAVPAPPEQSLRGLAVLRGLMETLEREAGALRAESEAAQAAQRELEAALPRLRSAQALQAVQAAQVDRQLEAARTLRLREEDAAADEARRAAAEATRAESVRAAIEVMQAARARAQALLQKDAERALRQRREAALNIARRRQQEISSPAGPGLQLGSAVVLPVAGPVVRRWGERTEAGPANGISFRAAPLGRVVAPCAGRVAFAGPFRSFGDLVILDCGGGYHFVLAGLERIDTEPGAAVEAGEPLGVMPNWDPAVRGSRPALYVELRRGGQPVDPSPFLRARASPTATQG